MGPHRIAMEGPGRTSPRAPTSQPPHTRGRLPALAASAAAMVLAATGAARACDYLTVRDSALDLPRDLHRIAVVAAQGDEGANETERRLRKWLDAVPGLNLEVLRVDAGSSETRWADLGIPSAPPSVPVVVLAGRKTYERRSFYVEHWEPAPSAEDLEVLRDSPAREAIRREVGRCLAVLLYLPGSGERRGAGEKAIEAVANGWGREQELPVKVVRVERSDPREGLLVSFTGVSPDGPDWVALVFGKGKAMPPLEGEGITEENLRENLEVLVEACTCLRPAAALGVDLPLLRDAALDDAALRLLGADAGTGAPARLAAAVGPAALPGAAVPQDLARRIWAWMLGGAAVALLLVGLFLWILVRRRAP